MAIGTGVVMMRAARVEETGVMGRGRSGGKREGGRGLAGV